MRRLASLCLHSLRTRATIKSCLLCTARFRLLVVCLPAAICLAALAPAAAPRLAAAPGAGHTFVVTNTFDAPDFDSLDDICASFGHGCTLRAAIDQANYQPDLDTISVPAGTFLLTRAGGVGDFRRTGLRRRLGVRYRFRRASDPGRPLSSRQRTNIGCPCYAASRASCRYNGTRRAFARTPRSIGTRAFWRTPLQNPRATDFYKPL